VASPVDIGPLAVNGQLEAIVVDPVGDAPTNVIRRSDPFRVDCRWFLDGPLAPTLGGQWRVELLGEGQGPAIEIEVPAPALIALDGRTGPGTPYTTSFNIPANSVNLLGRPQAVLDLTVALTYIDVAGNPGPLAAFVDLDKVMVFED
jgi:hypothetical protein